jgi:hypothetical protein
VPGHRALADDAGTVHPAQQRPGRVAGLRESGSAADVQPTLRLPPASCTASVTSDQR